MITLPYNIGGDIRDAIDKYRKENNMPEPKEVTDLGVYKRRNTFFEYEFKYVKDLNIKKETLEYINLFSDLKSIKIDTSDIIDSSTINGLLKEFTNIEKLYIKGQNGLDFLNLNHLTNLKELKLISNRSLNKIDGLDKLNSLKTFTFYDNNSFIDEKNLCKKISDFSNKDIKCDVDVLYMPTLQKNKFDEYNITWSENIGSLNDKITYSTKELEIALNKAKAIISNYIKPTDTNKEKFAILYQWMCENVRYDYGSLKSNNSHIKNGVRIGKETGANGTYNGLIYNQCVCEGYSKTMQLLLKLCDIKSYDVGCLISENRSSLVSINGKSKVNQGDHSIIKVNLDGKFYYTDTTWDAGRYQRNDERKYFLLSKKDISKDHLLTNENSNIALESISKQEFNKLMKFAGERVKSVNEKLEAEGKTLKGKLNDCINNLEVLRQDYGIIGIQIEELMERNAKYKLRNFQEQYEKLTNERDSIGKEIAKLYKDKETYKQTIEIAKQNNHRKIIVDVHKLTGIEVTPIKEYIYEPSIKGLNATLKDKVELMNDQRNINTKLEELCTEGKINYKTYLEYKKEISLEYEKLISKAPYEKKINNTQSINKPKENNQNITKPKENNQSEIKPKVEKIETIPIEFEKAYKFFKDDFNDKGYDEEDIDRLLEPEKFANKPKKIDKKTEVWNKIKPLIKDNEEIDYYYLITKILDEEIEKNEKAENIERRRRIM